MYYILGSFGILFKIQGILQTRSVNTKRFGSITNLQQIRWFLDMTSEYNNIMGEKDEDFSIEAFQQISTDGFPNSDYSLCELKINNIQTLLEWKKTMGRPKDLADVKLIEDIVYPLLKIGGGKTKKVRSTKKSKSTPLKKRSKKLSK